MVQKHHPHSMNKKAAHKPMKTTTFKKKKTTRAVMGDILQETVQIVQIARQRLILGQDPRMST